MYFVWLHGHGTSSCPGSRGAPTECRQGTYAACVSSMRRSTVLPMRAMIRMLTAT